jgi:hypothetical protein
LHKIYSLLSENNSSEKLAREEENNMAEGREMEKKRRHDELIAALKGMGGKQTATVVGKDKKEEGGGMFDSIMDFVKSSLDAIKKTLDGILEFVDFIKNTFKDLGLPLLKRVMSWFATSAVGGALLGLASMAALFALVWFGLKKLNEITPDMKVLSPDEAEAALKNGKAGDIEKLGGRQKLEDTIKNGKKRAQEVLDMPESDEKAKALLAMGGEDKVNKIAKDTKTYTVPTNIDTGPEKVPPRPTTGGVALPKKQEGWDLKYAQNYNPDGTKKVPTATPVTAPAAATAPVPAAPVSLTPPPPVSAPTSAPLNEKVNENQNLNLPPTPNPAPATTVNNTNVSNNSKPQQAMGKIPSVRNTEKTFSDMILYSTRVV